MKNAKVGVAGLLAGCLVCVAALGLHACYPKMLATDINSGRQFYSIYVTEREQKDDFMQGF